MSRISVNKIANRLRTKEINVVEVVDKLAARLAPRVDEPALRDNGSVLAVGDTYFNTTTNRLYTYKGGAWVVEGDTKAEKGANSDITSLSALTTALSVEQGGTAAKSAKEARSKLSVAPATGYFMTGLIMSKLSAGKLNISPGAAVMADGSLVEITTTTTLTTTGLTALTMYHIYMYVVNGVAAFEYNTIAPVVSNFPAHQKTGDSSRRYIGSFLSATTTDFFNFVHSGDVIMYNATISQSPFILITGLRNTVSTSVSVLSCAPITATAIRAVGCNNINNLANAFFSNANFGDASNGNFNYVMGAVASQAWSFLELTLHNGAFNFALEPLANSASGGVYIRASGYRFIR